MICEERAAKESHLLNTRAFILFGSLLARQWRWLLSCYRVRPRGNPLLRTLRSDLLIAIISLI